MINYPSVGSVTKCSISFTTLLRVHAVDRHAARFIVSLLNVNARSFFSRRRVEMVMVDVNAIWMINERKERGKTRKAFTTWSSDDKKSVQYFHLKLKEEK